jgi:tetratricopeptide (TPR) repeat protein
MTPAGDRFRDGIAANLAYWQEQIERLTDASTPEFIAEQANVILAVEMGVGLPATREKAASLLLLAYRFIERCGYWQRWLSVFEKATAVDLERSPLLNARLLNRQGQLARLMQQTELAMALHQQAERIAQAAGSQQALAEIWFNLSIDHWQRRDYEQADAYGRRALQIFQTVPENQRWQASMLNTLGLISQHRDRLAEAQERLQQSAALWRQFDEPTELARVLNNLANTCLEQDHLEAAHHYYQEALEHLASTGSALDKAEVLVNLGALYLKWGQYDRSEIALRQAASPAVRHSGYLRLRALLALNLGSTLLKQEQAAEAEKYLKQSVTLWQQLEEDLMLANTVGTLAEALAAQGQVETAVAHFDNALQLLDNFPANRWAQSLKEEFLTGKSTIDGLVAVPGDGGQRQKAIDRQ